MPKVTYCDSMTKIDSWCKDDKDRIIRDAQTFKSNSGLEAACQQAKS